MSFLGPIYGLTDSKSVARPAFCARHTNDTICIVLLCARHTHDTNCNVFLFARHTWHNCIALFVTDTHMSQIVTFLLCPTHTPQIVTLFVPDTQMTQIVLLFLCPTQTCHKLQWICCPWLKNVTHCVWFSSLQSGVILLRIASGWGPWRRVRCTECALMLSPRRRSRRRRSRRRLEGLLWILWQRAHQKESETGSRRLEVGDWTYS